jgi:hypothetical protein
MQEVLMEDVDEEEDGEEHYRHFGDHTVAPYCAPFSLDQLSYSSTTTKMILITANQNSINPYITIIVRVSVIAYLR